MNSARKRTRLFTRILAVGYLLGIAGCSEWPAEGTLSPTSDIESSAVIKTSEGRSGKKKLQPLRRIPYSVKDGATTATAYSGAKSALSDLNDELEHIANNHPNGSARSAISDAMTDAQAAMSKLNNGDGSGALGDMANAKSDIQGAIGNGLINSTQGSQLIAECNAIESAIDNNSTAGSLCEGTTKNLWLESSIGGLISHCGHKIEVPQNALPQDAQMAITLDDTGYIIAHLGPNGWFSSQVKVVIPYANADLGNGDPNDLVVAWLDESTNNWVSVGGSADQGAQTVSAWVWHFTQYTLSYD